MSGQHLRWQKGLPLLSGGEGTAPHFPRHQGTRPPPRGLQGSTQNLTSGINAVGQWGTMFSASPPWRNPTCSQTPSNPLPSSFPEPQSDAACLQSHLPGCGCSRGQRGGHGGVWETPLLPPASVPNALRVPGFCPLLHPRHAGTGTCRAGRMLSLMEEDAQLCSMVSACPRSGDAPRGGPKANLHVPWASWGDFPPAHSKWGHFKPALHPGPS